MGVVISFADAAPRARARRVAPPSGAALLITTAAFWPVAIPLLAMYASIEISRAWWRAP